MKFELTNRKNETVVLDYMSLLERFDSDDWPAINQLEVDFAVNIGGYVVERIA